MISTSERIEGTLVYALLPFSSIPRAGNATKCLYLYVWTLLTAVHFKVTLGIMFINFRNLYASLSADYIL